jgi:hypothetical protein
MQNNNTIITNRFFGTSYYKGLQDNQIKIKEPSFKGEKVQYFYIWHMFVTTQHQGAKEEETRDTETGDLARLLPRLLSAMV